LKLGILIPGFPAQTHVFFWREVRALEALNVEVQLFSTRRPDTPCVHEFAREAAGRTVYAFPPTLAAGRSLRSPARLGRVAAYVASLSDRGAARAKQLLTAACAAELAAQTRRAGIDHLHVHSCADAAHLAAMTHLLGGPTYSLHLHGDLPVYGRDHRQKMRHALFVAAAAEPMRRQVVEEAGVSPDRAFTMKMGVDTDRFTMRPLGPRRGPLHVVTVSRLALCKGHKHGLGALRMALDAGASLRYSIVGGGPDQAAIEADIKRLRLENHVAMVGSLGETQVAELLKAADVFLLPSVGIGEASPVAVMEAMATGVAIVCSRIGGTPDMITDGEDGLLVDQADEAGLAAALRRLHDDDDFRIRVSAAGRARAVRQFDARRLAERMLDVIRETKARPGSSAPAAAA
jgi:glycosyltransferase involved in cell wall biosynthesis